MLNGEAWKIVRKQTNVTFKLTNGLSNITDSEKINFMKWYVSPIKNWFANFGTVWIPVKHMIWIWSIYGARLLDWHLLNFYECCFGEVSTDTMKFVLEVNYLFWKCGYWDNCYKK